MEYSNFNRGKIQNKDRARQIIDFSGIRYGNITPTDIDGLIEYQNKAYIWFEYKLRGARFPDGQKIALERLANDLQKSGKPVIVILAEHNQKNCEKDIDAANSICKYFYIGNRWYPEKILSAKRVADIFIRFIDRRRLNANRS